MKQSIFYILSFLIFPFLNVSAQQQATTGDLRLVADTVSQTEEQERSGKQTDKFRLSLFVGPGISTTFENIADATTMGIAGLSLQVDNLLISFRRTFSGSALFNNDAHRDIGVLFGIVAPAENYHLSLAIGMGYMSKVKPNIFGSATHLGSDYSIPLAIQFYMPNGKSVIVGVYGLANFNRLQSFWGAAFTVQFMLNEMFN